MTAIKIKSPLTDNELDLILNLSIAIELLNDFIETGYARICNGEELSEEELEHLHRTVSFWEAQTGKKKGYASTIERQLQKI